MSTILKTKFEWAIVKGTILVYSDKARFFRESLFFTETDKKLTPHQAMEIAKENNVSVNLQMLSTEDKTFVKGILIGHGVNEKNIIL